MLYLHSSVIHMGINHIHTGSHHALVHHGNGHYRPVLGHSPSGSHDTAHTGLEGTLIRQLCSCLAGSLALLIGLLQE